MINNLKIAFFRFVTMHTFDRQTDGRTDRQMDIIPIAIPRLHSMQRGKNAFMAFHCHLPTNRNKFHNIQVK